MKLSDKSLTTNPPELMGRTSSGVASLNWCIRILLWDGHLARPVQAR
ncbi:hypothetical protein [Scytonema sp. PRP1]